MNTCAKCGADVGNAGIDRCVQVGDLDPDQPGVIRRLYFCYDCRGKVLNATHLAHYNSTKEPASS